MTARFTKKGRAYRLDGSEVTSVTTAIGVLDKPALVNWAAKMSADYAAEHWDELNAVPVMTRHERILKARFDSNRAATTKGHRIHALAEALAHGQTIRIPDDLERDGIEAYARLLDQWEMTTVATELPVCSTEYLYAGTADLVIESPRLGRVLLDAKTGKSIYSEVALQLAAYRYANVCLEEQIEVGPRGGKKTVLVERAMHDIDRTMAIHVRGDSVALHPIVTGPDIFDQFVRLLYLYDEWVKRTDSYRHKQAPEFNPPVREPIFPEISDTDLAELPN